MQQWSCTTPSTTAFVFLLLRRSTSGLGKGDGINNHTDKWLYVSSQSTVQCIQTPLPQLGLLNGPAMCTHTHARHADAHAVLLLCCSHTRRVTSSPLWSTSRRLSPSRCRDPWSHHTAVSDSGAGGRQASCWGLGGALRSSLVLQLWAQGASEHSRGLKPSCFKWDVFACSRCLLTSLAVLLHVLLLLCCAGDDPALGCPVSEPGGVGTPQQQAAAVCKL